VFVLKTSLVFVNLSLVALRHTPKHPIEVLESRVKYTALTKTSLKHVLVDLFLHTKRWRFFRSVVQLIITRFGFAMQSHKFKHPIDISNAEVDILLWIELSLEQVWSCLVSEPNMIWRK